MKVSVIIPIFNEEKVILHCLDSLASQTFKDFEIVLIDDGSTDNSKIKIQNEKSQLINQKITFLQQTHQGPGEARNLGASKAHGNILVFIDADMEFAPDFIDKLIEPIIKGKVIGTFSKEEYLLNNNRVYARCWNLNLGRPADRLVGERDYPNGSTVFRAILKSEFEKVGGFDSNVGYTDDWSISRKLNILATEAPGAKFYHRNPETLSEVWLQARWFGKNEFLTGNIVRKIYNLARYNPISGVILGLFGMINFQEILFFPFKIVYNSAVFTSVCLSFFGEKKFK